MIAISISGKRCTHQKKHPKVVFRKQYYSGKCEVCCFRIFFQQTTIRASLKVLTIGPASRDVPKSATAAHPPLQNPAMEVKSL
jgi:hypothetical protein